jgi:hypothetical protein
VCALLASSTRWKAVKQRLGGVAVRLLSIATLFPLQRRTSSYFSPVSGPSRVGESGNRGSGRAVPSGMRLPLSASARAGTLHSAAYKGRFFAK